MAEEYREGREYVVCPRCRSHLLLEWDYLRAYFEDCDEDDPTPALIDFTCDWDPCGEEFEAEVLPPRLTSRGSQAKVGSRGPTAGRREGAA